MPTSDRLGDERGAIMVLGIFMCTCLVGALWYLAGIGDAILLRERAQEAADAVAFSDAALHARGMNLIVLINLVMACVLGVRVALKIAQLILTIAAVVFAVLGYFAPVFAAAAAACLYGVQVLEQLITNTRQPINQSLQALSVAQDAVSAATPAAAREGALLMVGKKYEPVVTRSGVAHFGSESSLPIESGSQDKLCKEAGRSVGYLSGWVFEKANLGGMDERPQKWLGDKFAWLASTSPQRFCEMGSSTGDADVSELFDEPAKDRCDNEPEAGRDAFKASEAEWEKKCAEYGASCIGTDDRGNPIEGKQTGSTTPERQAELDRLRLLRDQDVRAIAEYDTRTRAGRMTVPGSCEQWAKADMKQRQYEQNELSKKQEVPSASGSKSGVTPKKVDSEFKNGVTKGQVAGGVLVDPSRLGRSTRLVRVGAWRGSDAKPAQPEGARLPSWAQAEFFFDCGGKWDRCNDDEEAMWHLKWRARLRRWNEPQPLDAAIATMGLGQGGRVDLPGFADAAEAMPSMFTANPELRAELERALRATRERGVH
ncbi:MAG TPA: hypothetical protein VM925_06785 [Labilithrix sp.]|nr:hypothetical protein [Labilithrix sp.]